MKKIFLLIIFLFFLSIAFFITILSTIGVETNKFNDLISTKLNENNDKVKIELSTIKFKFDIKELSLFLETNNPLLNYRGVDIPSKSLKVYVNIASFTKSDANIEKINLKLDQLDLKELKNLSYIFKPSNLTSFFNNKINQGKLNTEIEIYLDKENNFENYIARGTVKDLEAEIFEGYSLKETNFSFFADKTDILIKNIFSKSKIFEISNGDLRFILSPEISMQTNFKTNLKFNKNLINDINFLKKNNFLKDLTTFEAELSNSILINFDKTYKVKKYNYKSNGVVSNATLNLARPIQNNFFDNEINQISFSNSKINTKFDLKKKELNFAGTYSFDLKNYQKFNLDYDVKGNLEKYKLNFDFDKKLNFNLINYQKPKGVVSNINLNLDKKNNYFKINKLDYKEKNNFITVEDLQIKKEKFLFFKKVAVKTFAEGKKNNDFLISFGKKISIKGNQLDARNLPKILNIKGNKNQFSHINKEIEIDLVNIIAPVSEKLKNFKLIGKIESGKFSKISSKGDFGNNNFLDITMKNDKKTNKKYLEVYSDLSRPLLTEYNFFRGLSGGKLLYTSIIDNNSINSKLRIENFKVINAPGMVQLLSLADLGGLADLAKGEGISFETLEITMKKNNEKLEINEILAIGPSISVLMEGYQDINVTSLRGTLVPAKTLNKIISKIPVIGNIVIPKEVGEGLFGISFKIKGPPGAVKTTINPIRTITPRFIQKILEKKKE